MSYRDRIYAQYATAFKDSDLTFDAEAARRWGKPLRHYLRGWLPAAKDAAVADVACGSGTLLHTLVELGYSNVRGIDISAEQVALARQVSPHVSQGDALAFLAAHPGAFDLILALDIIEHFAKDEVLVFLDRCVAALRASGRLVLQTPNADSPMFNTIRYGDFTHEGAFTPAGLSRLLRMAGLRDVEARETGPVIRGAASLARAAVWQGIRAGLRLWHLAESGNPGSGIFTRVFVISGIKP